MNDDKPLAPRELTKYLLGISDETTKHRVEAELRDPDSEVNGFLGWLGDPDKHRGAELETDPPGSSPGKSKHGPSPDFQDRISKKPPESPRGR